MSNALCHHIIGFRGPNEDEPEEFHSLVVFDEGWRGPFGRDDVLFNYCPICGKPVE